MTLTGSAAVRGNHGLNTDRLKERSVKARGGGVGVGVGGWGRGGQEQREEWSAPAQSHELGRVGVRTGRYPGNIYIHTVDVASELVRKTRIFNRYENAQL